MSYLPNFFSLGKGSARNRSLCFWMQALSWNLGGVTPLAASQTPRPGSKPNCRNSNQSMAHPSQRTDWLLSCKSSCWQLSNSVISHKTGGSLHSGCTSIKESPASPQPNSDTSAGWDVLLKWIFTECQEGIPGPSRSCSVPLSHPP